MRVRVSDFPEPERVQDEGRDLCFTQIQRAPQEPQLGAFTIKLDGIPGPGPGRWIAVATRGARGGLRPDPRPQARDAATRDERRDALAVRKQQLLELAKQCRQRACARATSARSSTPSA